MAPLPPSVSFKRAGWILVILGLCDIGIMVACISNKLAYASPFNIFAIIAGLLLLRGSLKTASILRWGAAFGLAVGLYFLLALPLIEPVDLLLTYCRLYPAMVTAYGGGLILLFLFLGWLLRELGQEDVLSAYRLAGLRPKKPQRAALLGAVLVVALAGGSLAIEKSEAGRHAKELAAAQVRETYAYHVRAMQILKTRDTTQISAHVIAWNAKEIRTIPVVWEEFNSR